MSKYCRIQYSYHFGEDGKDVTDFSKINITPCCNASLSNVLIFPTEEFIADPFSKLEELKQYDCCEFVPACQGKNSEIDSIEVSLGRKCNANCIMCGFNHLNNTTLESNYKTLLNNIKGHNLKTIILTEEGEPFAYDWTVDYLKSLTTNDCKEVRILTNTITLSEEMLIDITNTLKENGIKLYLVVSFHSFEKDLYKTIFGIDNFEHAISIMKLANSLGVLENINYVLQECNKHELENIKNSFDEIDPSLYEKLNLLINRFDFSIEETKEIYSKFDIGNLSPLDNLVFNIQPKNPEEWENISDI